MFSRSPCSAQQHSQPLDLRLFLSGSQVRLMALAGTAPASSQNPGCTGSIEKQVSL